MSKAKKSHPEQEYPNPYAREYEKLAAQGKDYYQIQDILIARARRNQITGISLPIRATTFI